MNVDYNLCVTLCSVSVEWTNFKVNQGASASKGKPTTCILVNNADSPIIFNQMCLMVCVVFFRYPSCVLPVLSVSSRVMESGVSLFIRHFKQAPFGIVLELQNRFVIYKIKYMSWMN